MPDPGLCFIPHPLPVVSNVVGKALRAFPMDVRIALGVYGRNSRKLRWDFAGRLGNQHCYGIEIRPVRAQPEPLRLERNRAAAAERIAHRRRVLREIVQHRFRVIRWRRNVALRPGNGTSNLEPCLAENPLVICRLPRHHLLDDPVQPLPLAILGFFGGIYFRPCGRIVDQLRKQHRPACRERSPRPPEVKRRWMPVPDRFLSRRGLVDGVKRYRHLDEFLSLRCHGGADSPPLSLGCAASLIDLTEMAR